MKDFIDTAIFILFGAFPYFVGWAVILAVPHILYCNLLWKGIKHTCPLCNNEKEAKVTD